VITALMMGTEIAPETSMIFNQLTRLIAREYFIKFSTYLKYPVANTMNVFSPNSWFRKTGILLTRQLQAACAY
jgi:hypothetical protein